MDTFPVLHKKAREACAVTVGAVYDGPSEPELQRKLHDAGIARR
jgi:hypothetical protein